MWGHLVQGLRVALNLMMGHRVLVRMQVGQLEAHVPQSPIPAHGQLCPMQAADIHEGHIPVSVPEHLM